MFVATMNVNVNIYIKMNKKTAERLTLLMAKLQWYQSDAPNERQVWSIKKTIAGLLYFDLKLQRKAHPGSDGEYIFLRMEKFRAIEKHYLRLWNKTMARPT